MLLFARAFSGAIGVPQPRVLLCRMLFPCVPGHANRQRNLALHFFSSAGDRGGWRRKTGSDVRRIATISWRSFCFYVFVVFSALLGVGGAGRSVQTGRAMLRDPKQRCFSALLWTLSVFREKSVKNVYLRELQKTYCSARRPLKAERLRLLAGRLSRHSSILSLSHSRYSPSSKGSIRSSVGRRRRKPLRHRSAGRCRLPKAAIS